MSPKHIHGNYRTGPAKIDIDAVVSRLASPKAVTQRPKTLARPNT